MPGFPPPPSSEIPHINTVWGVTQFSRGVFRAGPGLPTVTRTERLPGSASVFVCARDSIIDISEVICIINVHLFLNTFCPGKETLKPHLCKTLN